MARVSSPDRSNSHTSPALTIAAGQMPAQGTFWLSSEVDGVGGTNATNAKGHTIHGHHPDIARVRLVVSNWHALTGIEFRAELDDGLGYALLDPAIETPFAGQFIDTTGGVVVVKSGIGTNPIILSVPVLGARRFRFGVSPADAGARGNVALTAAFRLIQRSVYA